MPFDGVSMVHSFDDGKAKGRKRTQYFDIVSSRGIYHDGWFAGIQGPRKHECRGTGYSGHRDD